MRCYFKRGGSILAVEFLNATDDQALIEEAHRAFETLGEQHHADAFEVWAGKRFIYRYPENPPSAP